MHLTEPAAIGFLYLWSVLIAALHPAPETQLRLVPDGDPYRIEILSAGEVVLDSPPEGLWSIATRWRDGWPAEWHHASPTQVERAGEWTLLAGRLETDQGTWELRDAYRPMGRTLKCIRRFEWQGPGVAETCTLSIRFRAKANHAQAFLPGILYYGNPSGAKTGRVPTFTGFPGEQAFFEEHRFPMPFAYIEWSTHGGFRGAALHSVPSPAPFANLKDQWWSLGIGAGEGTTDLVLLSGPCASNGKRSVIKAVQPGFVPYDNAYLSVPPGAVIEKTFFLEVFSVSTQGSGFRRPVHTALTLFSPFCSEDMPTFAEIVRDKYRFAKSRWHEVGTVAGFKKYPDRALFVMGWCGQAASPGYALQVLSPGLNDPAALAMAQKSLDFLSSARFYPGGFHTWYDCEKDTWSHHELLSQAQAMLNIANAVRIGRTNGMRTARWETFLRKACDLHAGRILADGWRPRSTDEAFFIAPLCESAKLFDADQYRRAALKAGQTCADRHLSMREPYWGGTLDAQCEDKEGAYAAMQGFLALYDLTGQEKFLRWAEHALDVVLSYVVVWDIPLPAGRLSDHRFRTRGWTVVSPQNQHIDVYGVMMTPDVYRLGQILNRDDLRCLAILMFRSCGQLIDPYGSQGEQPQHTNYAQRGSVEDALALRGGYQENWTVFWITAHFLNAAARLGEIGVPLWQE